MSGSSPPSSRTGTLTHGPPIGFLDQVDPLKSGGKGRALAELAADFPVPPGFIVTRDVWAEFKCQGSMPEHARKSIARHYQELCARSGTPLVAVRSSSAAEDSATASFAGLHDTYLYVGSVDEVLRRVEDCWASLESENAMAYRAAMNVLDVADGMAVVIQPMIEARCAGVLFTADPSRRRDDVMIIESNWGCGETVVSARSTPDHFEVSKTAPYAVRSSTLGAKEVSLCAGDGRGRYVANPPDRRNVYSLAPEEIAALCDLAARVEARLRCAQNIEWAIRTDGRLFLLQSRPITAKRSGHGVPA